MAAMEKGQIPRKSKRIIGSEPEFGCLPPPSRRRRRDIIEELLPRTIRRRTKNIEYLYLKYNCTFCNYYCNSSYFNAQKIITEFPEITQFCQQCRAQLPAGAIIVKKE